jgi:hypothetical protein
MKKPISRISEHLELRAWVWSPDPPKEPGLYWVWVMDNDTRRLVTVSRRDGVLMVSDFLLLGKEMKYRLINIEFYQEYFRKPVHWSQEGVAVPV